MLPIYRKNMHRDTVEYIAMFQRNLAARTIVCSQGGIFFVTSLSLSLSSSKKHEMKNSACATENARRKTREAKYDLIRVNARGRCAKSQHAGALQVANRRRLSRVITPGKQSIAFPPESRRLFNPRSGHGNCKYLNICF